MTNATTGLAWCAGTSSNAPLAGKVETGVLVDSTLVDAATDVDIRST